MLTVKLSGGLGNQFFQYAFASSINKNNEPIVVIYQSKTDETHAERNLSISKFCIPENTVFKRSAENIENPLLYRLVIINSKIFNRINPNDDSGKKKISKIEFQINNLLGYCIQKDHRYFFPKYKKNLYIEGMWHNPIYVEDNYDNICRYYCLKDEYITHELKSRINKVTSSESVCVHVRRGDYLSARGFNVLTLGYYKKSIDNLRKKLFNPQFFIFSDDIEWCKHNITGDDIIYIDNGFEDYQDFELMRNCKHFIISNSTFSWWAAYLGQAENKTVITPDIWFDNNPKKQMNLPGWIVMRSER